MSALLEAWYDYGVNREEKTPPNLIGPELENDENKMKDMKVDNLKQYQAYVILKKKKNEKK